MSELEKGLDSLEVVKQKAMERAVKAARLVSERSDDEVEIALATEEAAECVARCSLVEEVVYFRQGPYTIALAAANDGNDAWIGVSKKNPLDGEKSVTGRATALYRALRYPAKEVGL